MKELNLDCHLLNQDDNNTYEVFVVIVLNAAWGT